MDSSNQQFHLPNFTSTYTAEAFCVLKAVQFINQATKNNYVICTDSLSTILSIKSAYPTNPIIQKIQDSIHQSLTQSNTITILWVPSHCGIRGNEEADTLAKEGATLTDILHLPIPSRDLVNTVKQKMKEKLQHQWSQTTNNQLRKIKPSLKPWKMNGTRRERVAATRLRIGHTLLTHDFIFQKIEPTQCTTCGTRLTIEHILTECRSFDQQRITCKLPPTLTECLGNDNIHKALTYLKTINLFGRL
ncbi:hypothetical protein PPYR_02019 [Photinus pyralis]|uniref:RNase H type-1 domain-containing protein n=2 Tax=Photinus pyralis TaxID=7054 RepID=A0A5N4B616_PHOPY|nr:hypothetical protein PPYR_02019 [Photinus pyralis]